MTLAEKAERFRALHHRESLLRLLNAWDAGTARVLEAAGAPAVATTSAGVASALGHPDGESLSREEVIEATQRIAAAVEVPVTADVESGYGATPAEVQATVGAVVEVGAVGINLEDAEGPGLRDVEDAVERVRAARAAGEAAGVPLFVNARTDVFLLRIGEPKERLEHAISRLRAY